MILYPTDQARLAIRRDDLVILDLQAGTYACLPGAGAAIRPFGPAGAFAVSDPDLGDLLCEGGALDRTPPAIPSTYPATPPLPLRDLMSDMAPRSDVRDLMAIGLAYLEMARLFHRRSFAEILRAARRGAARAEGADVEGCEARVRRRALALRRELPWLPFQGECLYRAFLLRRMLGPDAHAALWVFGVQTWPFEAHCWLQLGDTVLDDAADRVAAYTPILAV